MSALSYKEFMEEVKMHLGKLLTEELSSIILSWASEEHPANRQEFLNKIIPLKQKKEALVNEKMLMDRIDAFAQSVDDGEYCDGWGWDDAINEERDWGDEGWAEEMDEFFLQARSLLLQSKYKLAEEVYRKARLHKHYRPQDYSMEKNRKRPGCEGDQLTLSTTRYYCHYYIMAVLKAS